jgi:hypothetical protein
MVAALVLAMALAHPIHSTLTELSEDRTRGVVRASIRVFADDYERAPGRVASSFAFVDRAGRALTTASCGIRRSGEVYWICLESASPGGLGGLKVRAAMLCDLYQDQVNVVQGTVAGAHRSLLFTRGDGLKAL